MSVSPTNKITNTDQDFDALLKQIGASGDRSAFAEIYHHFGPRVKGFLIRGGASPEEAEDIAQDTMVKVLNKANLFDSSKASASTWIFTIARNARIDAIRKRSKQELDAEEPAILPQEAPRADYLCELKDRDKRIKKAVALLSEDQRTVMTMHLYDDEPHSVIAKRLDLPLGTVKSRLRLGFDKIRNELGDLDE